MQSGGTSILEFSVENIPNNGPQPDFEPVLTHIVLHEGKSYVLTGLSHPARLSEEDTTFGDHALTAATNVPFEPQFRGGVFVASGDINGNQTDWDFIL